MKSCKEEKHRKITIQWQRKDKKLSSKFTAALKEAEFSRKGTELSFISSSCNQVIPYQNHQKEMSGHRRCLRRSNYRTQTLNPTFWSQWEIFKEILPFWHFDLVSQWFLPHQMPYLPLSQIRDSCKIPDWEPNRGVH